MTGSKSPEDVRLDEILKRMLNTPHKPHVEKQKQKQKQKKKKASK